ncbi:uncharacterized protein [Primulina eburnea]|uniref:uncharacterized protein n=1 Tax=Primulina eburnea TaxID=1245227 RepID=UPI003C6C75AC
MASLYFCCAVFGEATRKKTVKVDPKYLRLVDDLDRFNHYPWGRVAYRDAVQCLKKDLLGRYNYLTEAQGRKEVDGSFLVGGFVMPLQILAYECYPSVAQKVARRRDVDCLMLPRMFQWVTNTWSSNRAPTGADIAAAFGDSPIDDCLGFLTPTPEELVSPYYTTGIFVDSAPDAVVTRVLELWREGQTVICSDHVEREIGTSSQTQQIFEPNLQAIPEESAGGEIFKEDSGAFVLAVAGYSLSR